MTMTAKQRYQLPPHLRMRIPADLRQDSIDEIVNKFDKVSNDNLALTDFDDWLRIYLLDVIRDVPADTADDGGEYDGRRLSTHVHDATCTWDELSPHILLPKSRRFHMTIDMSMTAEERELAEHKITIERTDCGLRVHIHESGECGVERDCVNVNRAPSPMMTIARMERIVDRMRNVLDRLIETTTG